MNSQPLISVVTPMYNAENFILETINSVLSQTYENWEMIIVDNCSSDNSIEIVKSIQDDRIRLIELDYNSGGPARPRNVGIENSNGEYIAFVDADDLWKSEKLITISKYFYHYDIIYHSALYFSDDKDDTVEVLSMDIKTIDNLYEHLLKKHNIFSTSSMCIKTRVLDNYKFDEDGSIQGVEDYDLWIRLSKNNYKYAYEKSFLTYYREHSVAYSKNYKTQGQRERYLLKKSFSEFSIFLSPLFILYKYKRLIKSILSNIKGTIKMKKSVDLLFYIKEFIKIF